jgi:site-specific DNA-methyltransferase (adenine-specific)
MGKKWDYDVPSKEIWAECLRVLKPGGHLLAFAGTRTQHRMAVRIEDVGFEIRDMIAWVYGSGLPKSHNLKDDWKGWGTALKPALEPITVARKPLEGTVAENVLAHGTGALNIDGCRVRDGSETGDEKPVYAANHGNAVYGAGMGGGAWANTDGRWPANLIHDGSEEVLAGFPQSSTTGVRRQPERVQQDVRATPFTRGKAAPEYTDSGSAARFFYCAKASKKDRDEGLEGFAQRAAFDNPNGNMGGNMGSVTMRKNTHPTVKPTDLMRYLVRLVTPPNGTVLDPFMGSGSTGKAAMLEGFNFIGIEREAEYIEIAKARINWTLLC